MAPEHNPGEPEFGDVHEDDAQQPAVPRHLHALLDGCVHHPVRSRLAQLRHDTLDDLRDVDWLADELHPREPGQLEQIIDELRL